MLFDPKPNRLGPLYNQHQILNARFDLRGDWLIPSGYTVPAEEAAVLHESVGLIDISARGKLVLKGANSNGVIAARFGDATRGMPPRAYFADSFLIAGLTPDECLIFTPPGAEKELAAWLENESASHRYGLVSVIDLTSGLVGLSMTGPKSTGVMRKLCALPFNSKDFPDLWVAQSSFANVRTTIIRHNWGVIPSFELFADRSYGEYLWEAILDAGREFGMQPVGWEALENPLGQI